MRNAFAMTGVLLALLTACNAVLGIEDPFDRPDGGDGGAALGGTSPNGGSGGTPSGGAAGVAWAGGGSTGDASSDSPIDATSDGCIAKTCNELGAECGSVSDGCGNTIVCPSCAISSICSSNKCCAPAVAVVTAGPVGACGEVCSPANASLQDDKVAGLDCKVAGGAVVIDGQAETACVKADFGTTPPSTIFVRGRTTKQACTTGCSVGSNGDGCTMGSAIDVLKSNDGTSWTHAPGISFSLTLTTFQEKTVELGAPYRYVLVCRGGYGYYYRDVEIDVIRSATCP